MLFSQHYFTTLSDIVTVRLVSGIPDKIKFIIWPASYMRVPKPALETLMITSRVTDGAFQTWFLKILTKRWRTLDLISMMKEFSRSRAGKNVLMGMSGVEITDRLSSLPRLKKEAEDLTN